MSRYGAPVDLEVGGRVVRVTKPDRVLWPRFGLTKTWMISYYREVADVLLPHVRGHPLTLHRFPEGVEAEHWYQTRAPAHPPWVRTVTFRPERSGKVFDVVVLDDVAGLVWAAQIGAIELHPYLGTADALDRPRSLVLDLDPGPPAGIVDAASVALLLRDLLAAVGLAPYPKSSGQKGVHVVVPLDGSQTYGDTKRFARALAGLLAKEHPDTVTDSIVTDRRLGRVFVDWSQNDPGKSTVAPYSLRGLEIPTVSTPLSWDEVDAAVRERDPRLLHHDASSVLRRLETLGDLTAPGGDEGQRLPVT